MSIEHRRTAWILGSGFSRSLGGPLLDDLLSERGQAEGRARVGDCFGNIHDLYWKHLRGHSRQQGPTYWRNAEEFLDFVQSMTIENSPRRKMFETSDPDDLHRLALLAVATECLFDAHASQEAEAWQPYIAWAKRLLNPGDTIITFNYDCVVDYLVGWYPEQPFRVPEPPLGSLISERDVINVLKLHGSVNWFEGHIVRTGVDDPIKVLATGQTPILGTPNHSKRTLSTTTFRKLWEAAVDALKKADTIIFMGYRFPPSDSYARGTLLSAIGQNERANLRIHTVLGPRTSDDDTVRLLKLLEHTLRGAGRVCRGEGHAMPPEPMFFEIIAQPLYVEDFLTVIHDNELHGERLESLVLTGCEGSDLSDVDQDTVRVEVLDTDPSYTVIYSGGGLGHPDLEEVQVEANNKKATVWLALEVHNRAGVPARNVIVDFTVSEASVTLDDSTVGSQVRIEGPEEIPGGGKIRQRVTQISSGTFEKLALVGVRPYGFGCPDEVSEALVRYVLRHEDGVVSEGSFDVRVRIRGTMQQSLKEAVECDN